MSSSKKRPGNNVAIESTGDAWWAVQGSNLRPPACKVARFRFAAECYSALSLTIYKWLLEEVMEVEFIQFYAIFD
jgi:hypothetical protein